MPTNDLTTMSHRRKVRMFASAADLSRKETGPVALRTVPPLPDTAVLLWTLASISRQFDGEDAAGARFAVYVDAPAVIGKHMLDNG